VFSCTAFFSYILPAKLGLPLRYCLIVRHQKIPASTVGVTMVIDSMLGLIVWTLCSAVLGGDLVFQLADKYLPEPDIGVLALVALGGALSLALFYRLGKKRWRGWWKQLRTDCAQVRPARLILAALLLLIDIGGYVARHAAILAALSAPFIGWHAIAVSTVLSIYAGFLCMLPMGLIGYDTVMILLLGQYGIAPEIAVMVPLLNRSANLLLSALLGVPSSLRLGLGVNPASVTATLSNNRHV
jgi:uncharacterized membrane protein YbhN (UPF0104 family)